MFRPTIAAVALAFAAPFPALAQDAERMDEVVSAEADRGRYMGAALVAIGDEIVFDKAYGNADLEWGIANTPQAKFRIGSVTKQFTAAAILLLQEQGKLSLDSPVKAYWPAAPQAWDAITVRHLLQHTSGLPNLTDLDEFATRKYLPTTRDEAMALFTGKPLEFEPGAQWKYSNSGYVVLSAIIEELSGQSYAEYVKANIFDPLGMNDTAVDTNFDIVPRRAEGYQPSADGPVHATYINMAIPTGAGALYSTTHDLLKWQRGLYGGKLLQPESLAAMIAPGVAAQPGATYALGVMVSENDRGRTIWHGGGIEGFNAMLMYDPDREISVAVLANINGGQANDLGLQLMTLARGGEVTPTAEPEFVDIDPATIGDYEGSYALSPEFKIRVFAEGSRLKAQATNQPAFELFAEKGEDDLFFVKIVDARIRFHRGADGAVESLTLIQNGQEIPGAKE